MPLVPATQSQLIRSSQKDDHYQAFLRNNANKAFQTLAGCKKWLDWRKEIELLSDLTYYSLTSFSGYQTLGEEYVNIVQVDPSKRQLPSQAKRGMFVFSHIMLPYLLDKVLMSMENEIEGGPENRSGLIRQQAALKLWSLESFLRRRIQNMLGLLSEAQKRAFLLPVFALQQGLAFLYRFHVALFYISGSYYHLSKRTASISYVSVMRRNNDDGTIKTSYRLLGALSLLQVVITVCLQFNDFRQGQNARQDWKHYRNFSINLQQKASLQDTQTMGPRATRCILCLEERINSTCTPCGHLFCWDCITQWCNNKAECPLCRDKFQPQRLVYLKNFS